MRSIIDLAPDFTPDWPPRKEVGFESVFSSRGERTPREGWLPPGGGGILKPSRGVGGSWLLVGLGFGLFALFVVLTGPEAWELGTVARAGYALSYVTPVLYLGWKPVRARLTSRQLVMARS